MRNAAVIVVVLALSASLVSAAEGSVDCIALMAAYDRVLSAVISASSNASVLAMAAYNASVPPDIAEAHRRAYETINDIISIVDSINTSDRHVLLTLLGKLDAIQEEGVGYLNAYANTLLGCSRGSRLALDYKLRVDEKITAIQTILLPSLRTIILQRLGATGALDVEAPEAPVYASEGARLTVHVPPGARIVEVYAYTTVSPDPYYTARIHAFNETVTVYLPAPDARIALQAGVSSPTAIVTVEVRSGGREWIGQVEFHYLRPPVTVRVPAIGLVCNSLPVELYSTVGSPFNVTVLVDGEEYARLVLDRVARIHLDTCNMTVGYHVITVDVEPTLYYRGSRISSTFALSAPATAEVIVRNPSIDILARVQVGLAYPPEDNVTLTVEVSGRNYTVVLGPRETSVKLHPSLLPVWSGTVRVYTPWSREPVYEGRVYSISPLLLLLYSALLLPLLSAGGLEGLGRALAAGFQLAYRRTASSAPASLRVYLSTLYRWGAPRIEVYETLREHLRRSLRLLPGPFQARAARALKLVEEDLYSPRRVPVSRIRRVLRSGEG